MHLKPLAFAVALSLLAPMMGIAQEEAGCLVDTEFGKAHGRALETLSKVISARCKLSAYDRLLALVPLEERDRPFMYQTAHLRYEALQDALTAYYMLGPMQLSLDSDATLYEQLVYGESTYENYQMPASLVDLVTFGILPHLPQSPYAGGQWLNEAPATDPDPGSVLYMGIPAESAYLATEAGLLEGWLLVIYGTGDEQVLDSDQLHGSFGGDLASVLDPLPQTAMCLWGQDVNSI